MIKIQSWLRGHQARTRYKNLSEQEEERNFLLSLARFVVLVSADRPPVETVRKFLHLLDHSDLDFSEELGIVLESRVVLKFIFFGGWWWWCRVAENEGANSDRDSS